MYQAPLSSQSSELIQMAPSYYDKYDKIAESPCVWEARCWEDRPLNQVTKLKSQVKIALKSLGYILEFLLTNCSLLQELSPLSGHLFFHM